MFESLGTYDLTGGWLSQQLINAGNQSLVSLDVAIIQVAGPNQNSGVSFYLSQGLLSVQVILNNVSTFYGAVTYDPAAHVFFRVRESAGTMYWETSPDNVSWAPFYSQADPFPVTSVYACGCLVIIGSEATGTTVIYGTVAGGGPVTVGATNGSGSGGFAVAEIPALSMLAEDASSPAPVTTTSATSVSTAHFTPPMGSLLVAMAATAGGTGITVTDDNGMLAWVQLAEWASGTSGYAGVWAAVVVCG